MCKKRMISGIKPTGRLHLGNYIGAISQFIKYQDEYDMYIFIANLHAITIQITKAELKKNTRDLIALYLACGLDPEKVCLFLQSDITEHSELGWILTCNSYMGELNRMTQYKDKLARGEENISAGLFTYPSLMAGDIFLYDADYVPVGQDQKQHVELAKTLAQRFNHRYGELLKMPEIVSPKIGAKVMSLSNPTKKMSKSEQDAKGTIDLLDKPEEARKKILSAVTDSIGEVNYNPENQAGVSNLLVIYSSLTGEAIESICERYRGLGYKEFKTDLGDIVAKFLTELQERYQTYTKGDFINLCLSRGGEKAREQAFKKMRKIKSKIGFDIK